MTDESTQLIPRLTPEEFEKVVERAIREEWTELYVAGSEFDYFADSSLLIHVFGIDLNLPAQRHAFRLSVKSVNLPSGDLLRRLTSFAWCGFELPQGQSSRLSWLINLTFLNIRRNNIGDEGVPHLSGLTKLTHLNLVQNNIVAEGARHLAGLTELIHLDLRGNKIRNDGAAQLSGLTELTYLNLAGNDIGAEGVRHLSGLTNLNELNLVDNQIGNEGAQNLSGLINLTYLNLYYNNIGAEGVQHLSGLTNLRYLELTKNKLGDEGFLILAEYWKQGRFPNLQLIELQGNGINSVDPTVLEGHDPKQIFEAYFNGRLLPHARVMFVGMGGVGKSAIAHRSFCDQFVGPDDPHDSTHDIKLIRPDQCRWKPKVRTSEGEKEIDPHIWDFAGQLVTHGIHESFLESDGRTVYVLTLAADRVPGNSRQVVNETETNRWPYWLNLIHHFAGDNVPTIVAITRCDRTQSGDRKIDEPLKGHPDWDGQRVPDLTPDLLLGTHGVWVTRIVDGCSAHRPDYPIEPLRTAIQDAVGQLSAVREGKVPAKLPDLKEHVEKQLAGRTVVSLPTFFSWCEEQYVREQQEQLSFLQILHYIGSLIHLGGRSKARDTSDLRGMRDAHVPAVLQNHILNPRWFKWCVYEITRESERQTNERPDGWFTVSQIERIVSQATVTFIARESDLNEARENAFDDCGIVREALEHIKLCWHDTETGHYLFPRGLPALPEEMWESWSNTSLEWDFLPEANVARLIVELHNARYIVRGRNGNFLHGKNGAVIADRDHPRTRLAVVANPDDGRVEIRFDPSGDPERWPELLIEVKFMLEKLIQGRPAKNRPIVPRFEKPSVQVPVDQASEPKIENRERPELMVDEGQRSVQYSTNTIFVNEGITPTEWDLLLVIWKCRPWVATVNEILKDINKQRQTSNLDSLGAETLEKHISSLRKKLRQLTKHPNHNWIVHRDDGYVLNPC